MGKKSERPSRVSDIAAIVGTGLTLALVGYLAWDAARAHSAPSIVASVVDAEVRTEGGDAYVPIDVRNEGDDPAAAVVLETRGAVGDGAQTVIDYLAGRERVRVVVLVEGGGSSAGFRARVRSYQEP